MSNKDKVYDLSDLLILICLSFSQLFNSVAYAFDPSVSIASPGAEILSLSKEKGKKCQVNLLAQIGTWSSVVVQLNGPPIYEDRIIWGLMSLTQVGWKLLEELGPKIRSGDLKFARMTKAMIESFKTEVNKFATPKASYVHEDKTVYLNDFKNTGEVLLTLIHELQHAKDHLSHGSYALTPQEIVSLEFTAYETEDRFFEEFIFAAPCFKDLFPDFPRKYSTEKIRELYPHLR